MGRFRKIIVIGLAGAVGLSLLGGTVLARPSSQHASDEFSSVLDGLVENGVINQDQALAVLEATDPLFSRLDSALHHGQQGPGLSPRQIIGSTADILGIDPHDLIEQLQDGATLVEIIEANGSTVDAVVQELSAQLQTRLDEAVAAGEMTAEQAEQFLTNFQARVTNLIETINLGDGQHKPKRDRSPVAGLRGAQQIIGGTADILGIEPQDLMDQLREGASLVEIIEASGWTVDAVVQELSAQLQARLDEAVAAGEMTAEQAENVLANFQTQATNAIESGGVGRVGQENQGPRRGSRFDNGDNDGRPGRRVGPSHGSDSRFGNSDDDGRPGRRVGPPDGFGNRFGNGDDDGRPGRRVGPPDGFDNRFQNVNGNQV